MKKALLDFPDCLPINNGVLTTENNVMLIHRIPYLNKWCAGNQGESNILY